MLSRIRQATGDYPAAAAGYARAAALYRELGNQEGVAEVLTSEGALLAATAGPAEALPRYRQALESARAAQCPLEQARALEGIARCRDRLGDRAAAVADLGAAVELYRRVGAAEAGPAAEYLAGMSVGVGVEEEGEMV